MKVSSPGGDGIHVKIKSCDIMSPFLAFIMNKSFKEGCFPAHLKLLELFQYSKNKTAPHQNIIDESQ